MSGFKREHLVFILRKLHSLTGIVPIGAFLVFHLFENSHALKGPEAYNHMVEGIASIPLIRFMEIFFIWIPILYHAIYGVVLVFGSRPNVKKYPEYFNNWMYTFQRWSGIIAFAFIGWHFWGTWMQGYLYGETIDFNMMKEIVASPWQMAFYIIGVGAAVYHFSNGIWTFCISWGITIGPRSQKIVHGVCLLLGLVVFLVALNTLFAFKV
ncbi:MAG TPA: succinate dehydrogenase cytochrome b558 subunit [Bdellovibrionota bacterium]|nr:succinate dehydrogenase cytochrome b558 subunit [Bdellovibrionota bacterium]